MPNARVVWIEHNAFLGTDSSQHATLVSSQQGESAYGIKPTELCLISLASCTAVTFVQVMEKGVKVERTIEVGLMTETEAEVVKGLAPGERIVSE